MRRSPSQPLDQRSPERVFDFRVRVQELYARGFTIRVRLGSPGGQKGLDALALIDTGAADTAISPAVRERLALDNCDTRMVHEAGRDPYPADIVRVHIAIPELRYSADRLVVALRSVGDGIDLLLGRDIMAHWGLVLDFTSGKFRIHVKE